MSSKATVTTPAEREIRIERVFDAPRERLFEVFTDPELIPRWWGPRGTTTVVEEMDPTKGGRWRFLMRDPEGAETRFSGTYREVSPPDRLVQTFEWDGMPGHISLEEITLEDLGERTRVVNVSTFHHASERDGMLASGMERGLNETYERLDEVLAG